MHPATGRRLIFEDHFDGPDLDRDVWLPHYLPAWSSRAATAATYSVRDSCLHLSIPPAEGGWALPGASRLSDAAHDRGLRLP